MQVVLLTLYEHRFFLPPLRALWTQLT